MRTLTITPNPRRMNPPPPPMVPGRFARARHAAAEIAPETIERIAQRVVQLMHHEPETHDEGLPAARDLMDASQLARHLGLTRAWVYEHAEQLGAIQLGDGPRPRLRFDPQVATQALDERRLDQRAASQVVTPARPVGGRPRPRREQAVPLLPVHGSRVRGIVSRFAFRQRTGS